MLRYVLDYVQTMHTSGHRFLILIKYSLSLSFSLAFSLSLSLSLRIYLDVGVDVVLGAEIHHLLRRLNSSDQRARDRHPPKQEGCAYYTDTDRYRQIQTDTDRYR